MSIDRSTLVAILDALARRYGYVAEFVGTGGGCTAIDVHPTEYVPLPSSTCDGYPVNRILLTDDDYNAPLTLTPDDAIEFGLSIGTYTHGHAPYCGEESSNYVESTHRTRSELVAAAVDYVARALPVLSTAPLTGTHTDA